MQMHIDSDCSYGSRIVVGVSGTSHFSAEQRRTWLRAAEFLSQLPNGQNPRCDLWVTIVTVHRHDDGSRTIRPRSVISAPGGGSFQKPCNPKPGLPHKMARGPV